MSRRDSLVIAVGLLLAASRIALVPFVETPPFAWFNVYKDLAHLFMGGLLVASLRDRLRWQWVLFWSLNAIETVCAVVGRL